MAVSTSQYEPLLFSERLAAPPMNLCRAASLAMAWDAATNGDWTTNPDGSRWGAPKIEEALRDMRKAAGPDTDGNGYNQGHVPEFLRAIDAPVDAYEVRNVEFSKLIDDLEAGYVVELAGNAKHTPQGSPLRKYVGDVAHDILLLKVNDGRISFIDPMTPHGTAGYVRTAPIGDFRDFGSEFRTNGSYVAGRVKRGEHSLVARRTAAQAAIIVDVQKKLLVCQKLNKEAVEELETADAKVEHLENRVDELKARVAELESVYVDIDAVLTEITDIEGSCKVVRHLLA
jgi:hypothetical protein